LRNIKDYQVVAECIKMARNVPEEKAFINVLKEILGSCADLMDGLNKDELTSFLIAEVGFINYLQDKLPHDLRDEEGSKDQSNPEEREEDDSDNQIRNDTLNEIANPRKQGRPRKF
jgi:hypothetical protein